MHRHVRIRFLLPVVGLALLASACSTDASTTILEPVATGETSVDVGVTTDSQEPAATVEPTEPPADAEDASERSEEDVLLIFEAYRSALLTEDGAAAQQLVTASTFAYYDRVLEAGINADADELLAIPLSDALGVLAMRAQFGSDLVTIEDGAELFGLGVEAALVGDNIAAMQFDRIDLDGDEAFGVVQGQRSMRFEFDDGWLLDLPFTTSLLDDNEGDFVAAMTGGSSSRSDLFDIIALAYSTSWAELSMPVG